MKVRKNNLFATDFLLVALIILTSNYLFGQNQGVQYSVSVNKILMGTTVETIARHSDINLCKKALVNAYKEMQRVEDLLSFHKKGSEINSINSLAGIHPVKVSFETYRIIKNSIIYSKQSKGLFDVSIGSVSKLWGFNDDSTEIKIPAINQLDSVLKLVNYKNIILSERDTTVYLKQKEMKLDLGGIAKGYAIDRAAAVLKNMGVNNFILNAGGDIYVSGKKDENTQWKIGIKDPRNITKLAATFNLENYAVATSGDYERFKIINNVRYHHILNPNNGFPGRLSQSCTVIAQNAEQADALATYLFLLGAQKAMLDKSINFPYLIISSEGKKFYNNKFRLKFNPTILR